MTKKYLRRCSIQLVIREMQLLTKIFLTSTVSLSTYIYTDMHKIPTLITFTFYQYMNAHYSKFLCFESECCSVMPDSLQPHGLYSPWNSPGQNPGVGSIPFSRGSSQPRDQTLVSWIKGRFFTS